MNLRRWFILAVVALTILVGLDSLNRLYTHAQGQELLTNGNMEQYYGIGGSNVVPLGWTLSIPGGVSTAKQQWQFTNQQYGGSWHVSSSHFAFTMVASQFVAGVRNGTKLRFSIEANVFTCNTSDSCINGGRSYRVSDQSSGSRVKIGIDPTGAKDANASTVQWSGVVSPWDNFQTITVDSTSQNDNGVTLYLYGTQDKGMLLNDIFWDNASLQILGAGAPGGSSAPPTAPKSVPFVTPQGAQPDGSIIHIVAAGDTLNSIAVAYKVSVADIRSLNNMAQDSSIITPGQKLIIKGPNGSAGPGSTGGPVVVPFGSTPVIVPFGSTAASPNVGSFISTPFKIIATLTGPRPLTVPFTLPGQPVSPGGAQPGAPTFTPTPTPTTPADTGNPAGPAATSDSSAVGMVITATQTAPVVNSTEAPTSTTAATSVAVSTATQSATDLATVAATANVQTAVITDTAVTTAATVASTAASIVTVTGTAAAISTEQATFSGLTAAAVTNTVSTTAATLSLTEPIAIATITMQATNAALASTSAAMVSLAATEGGTTPKATDQATASKNATENVIQSATQMPTPNPTVAATAAATSELSATAAATAVATSAAPEVTAVAQVPPIEPSRVVATNVPAQPSLVCILTYDGLPPTAGKDVPLLAGVNLRILQGGSEVKRAQSEKNGPTCLENLSAGTYTLLAEPPSGYGMATPGQIVIDVRPGARLDLIFGAISGLQATKATTPDKINATDSTASNDLFNRLYEKSGLIVLALAGVVFFGGIAAVIMVSRRG